MTCYRAECYETPASQELSEAALLANLFYTASVKEKAFHAHKDAIIKYNEALTAYNNALTQKYFRGWR